MVEYKKKHNNKRHYTSKFIKFRKIQVWGSVVSLRKKRKRIIQPFQSRSLKRETLGG